MAEDSEAPPIANGETSPKQQHGRFFPYRWCTTWFDGSVHGTHSQNIPPFLILL
jgi:hypothetical protein